MKNLKELEIGGLSFGLTSGIITTLGLIVGVNSATDSKLAIAATILVIAVADSLSDALGMYSSEESRKDEKKKPIWIISLFTLLGKMLFSLIFLIPIVLLELDVAVVISVIAGSVMIALLSGFIAHRSNRPVFKEVSSHVLFTGIVILASFYLGTLADRFIE